MPTLTRKIVKIDEDKCDGCGLCVPDCAEGAIQVIDGKARLLAENLCDGLGNCLGVCPNDAITVEERPADDFDESAVEVRLKALDAEKAEADKPDSLPCGCPGTMMRKLDAGNVETAPAAASACDLSPRPSQLGHWPVQLALLPPEGDMWDGADVLISADCVGFAMPDFHERMLAGGKKALAIACPKLDDVHPYVDKLAHIFASNDIRSLTVAHMEVPCCTGIVVAVREALAQAGADIPLRDVTVNVNGTIKDERSDA